MYFEVSVLDSEVLEQLEPETMEEDILRADEVREQLETMILELDVAIGRSKTPTPTSDPSDRQDGDGDSHHDPDDNCEHEGESHPTLNIKPLKGGSFHTGPRYQQLYITSSLRDALCYTCSTHLLKIESYCDDTRLDHILQRFWELDFTWNHKG